MISRLEKYCSDFGKTLCELPGTHVTSVFVFDAILDSGVLKPQLCKVFKKELTYVFLGRPAYKLNVVGGPSSSLQNLPVCFVVRPEFINPIDRVYPFDSGAFNSGRYEGLLPYGAQIDDFRLTPTVSAARGVIERFYGTNEKYLLNRPLQGLTFLQRDLASASYWEFIGNHQVGKFGLDERTSSIEMQISSSLSFPKAFEAIVLPDQLIIPGSEVQKCLEATSIKVIPYPVIGNFSPAYYTSSFYQILRDHCAATGRV